MLIFPSQYPLVVPDCNRSLSQRPVIFHPDETDCFIILRIPGTAEHFTDNRSIMSFNFVTDIQRFTTFTFNNLQNIGGLPYRFNLFYDFLTYKAALIG